MNAPEIMTDHTLRSADVQLSFLDIVKFYYRKKALFLAIFLIVFILSVTFMSTRKDVYRAQAVITSATAEGSSRGLNAASGLSGLLTGGGANSTTPEFLEFINSFDTMRLADRLAQDQIIMQGAFKDQWNPQSRRWHAPRSIRYAVTSSVKSTLGMRGWHPPTAFDLQAYMSDRINIEPIDKSNFYNISFEHEDKSFSYYMLKSAIRSMDDIIRQQKIKDLTKRESYLRSRLDHENNTTIINENMSQISTVISNIVFLKGRDYYSVNLIDPPFVYPDPVRPKASYTLVVSTILGIIVSIIFVFLIGLIKFSRKIFQPQA